MPKHDVVLTKHAKKRVRKGDKHGLRTKLAPHELIDLMKEEHVVKAGSHYFAYSKVDGKVLEIVTGKQGTVVITVHDTSQRPHRIPDMVTCARAGVPFEFSVPPPVTDFSESRACRVTLGVARHKKGIWHITHNFAVGYTFNIFEDTPSILESRFLHELIVSSYEAAIATGSLSKTRLKKLRFIVEDERNNFFLLVPIWIAYDLLGKKKPEV